MANNGFFGQIEIKGPFTGDIFETIQQQCQRTHGGIPYTIDYINKIGIHYPVNYDLDIKHKFKVDNGEQNQFYPSIDISSNENGVPFKTFVLGKTGILELENIIIRDIIFNIPNDDYYYIDYQYVSKVDEERQGV